MIIDRPCVSAAFCANSRAIRATASAGTTVIGSCQAGVYGRGGVVVPAGHSPGRSVAAHAVLREHQVEDGRDEVPVDATDRHAARQHGCRSSSRSKQEHVDDALASS